MRRYLFDSQPCRAAERGLRGSVRRGEGSPEVEEQAGASDIAVSIAESGVGPVDDHRRVAVDEHVQGVEVAVARDDRPGFELREQRFDPRERRGQLRVVVCRQEPAYEPQPALHQTLAVGLGPVVSRQGMQSEVQ